MIKLLRIFRRDRAARIVCRPADTPRDLSPRDWADLPVYHPAVDDSARR